MANTHSHLTLSDRIYIEQALERRMKFKDIAVFIGKDPTTVSSVPIKILNDIWKIILKQMWSKWIP